MNYFALMVGITRDYCRLNNLPVPKQVDMGQASPNERFTCRSCHYTGPLSVHGHCARCDSDSVHPFALLDGGKATPGPADDDPDWARKIGENGV